MTVDNDTLCGGRDDVGARADPSAAVAPTSVVSASRLGKSDELETDGLVGGNGGVFWHS
jgi:hypothetical protein